MSSWSVVPIGLDRDGTYASAYRYGYQGVASFVGRRRSRSPSVSPGSREGPIIEVEPSAARRERGIDWGITDHHLANALLDRQLSGLEVRASDTEVAALTDKRFAGGVAHVEEVVGCK